MGSDTYKFISVRLCKIKQSITNELEVIKKFKLNFALQKIADFAVAKINNCDITELQKKN